MATRKVNPFKGLHLRIVDRGNSPLLPMRDVYLRDGLNGCGQSTLLYTVEVPLGFAIQLSEWFSEHGVPTVYDPEPEVQTKQEL